MELVKIDIDYPAGLTEPEKEQALEAKQPAMKSFNSNDLIDLLMLLVKKATLIAGQKVNEEYIEAAVEILHEKIISGRYGSITYFQIERAIKNGASGEYGEFMGINAKTIHSWIARLFKDQERLRIKMSAHEAKLAHEKRQKEVNDYYIQHANELLLKRLKTQIENLKNDKPFHDLGGLFYKYFVEKGKIHEPHEREEHFLNLARKKVEDEKRSELKWQRGEAARKQIKDFINGLKEPGVKLKARIESTKEQLIIEDFLRKQIEAEKV